MKEYAVSKMNTTLKMTCIMYSLPEHMIRYNQVVECHVIYVRYISCIH